MTKIRQSVQLFFIWYFRLIARFVIWRCCPKVITITGSVGKTTTKDVLIAQFSSVITTGGTIRSQNSEISTPLSILGIEIKNRERSVFVWVRLFFVGLGKVFFYKTPKVLILEVGAGGPGDITAVCKWLKSDFAVFTALAKNPVHVDHFESRQHLFNEKKQLALLSKENAVVLFPKEDTFLKELLSDINREIKTVSRSDIKEVQYNPRGTNIIFPDETQVQVNGVWSEVISQSYIIGLKIAQILELSTDVINRDFSKYYTPTPGRARLLEGIHGSTVIDDSYNASPVAVSASLEVLSQVSVQGRKIFLFGDMKELGEYSVSAHENVAQNALNVIDVLLTIGEESLITRKTILSMGFDEEKTLHFKDSVDAGKWLSENMKSDDIVLAKSSRHAIKMELALQQIVSPEQRHNLVQEYLK